MSNLISPAEFRIKTRDFIALILFRHAKPWLAALGGLLCAGIILGIALDVRYLILALMVLFIITPGTLALIIISKGLHPNVSFNFLTHSIEQTDMGFIVKISPMTVKEKPGDEQTGDEKSGKEQTGDEKTGKELTGDEQTGDEKSGEGSLDKELRGEQQIEAAIEKTECLRCYPNETMGAFRIWNNIIILDILPEHPAGRGILMIPLCQFKTPADALTFIEQQREREIERQRARDIEQQRER